MPTSRQSEKDHTEQPPDLTPEDEVILDKIWDEIGKEEKSRSAKKPESKDTSQKPIPLGERWSMDENPFVEITPSSKKKGGKKKKSSTG